MSWFIAALPSHVFTAKNITDKQVTEFVNDYKHVCYEF